MAPKHSVAVILAAGLGTRMKSRTPKVLHPICGRPMLAYVVDAATAATGAKPLVVYSPQTDALRAAFAGQADFALQKKPNGTGDALAAADLGVLGAVELHIQHAVFGHYAPAMPEVFDIAFGVYAPITEMPKVSSAMPEA